MKWLGGLAIVLCVLVSILAGGSVVLGRAQPAPAVAQAVGLDSCNGSPCFRGIVPGITTWNEAQSITKDLPPVQAPSFTNSFGGSAAGNAYGGNNSGSYYNDNNQLSVTVGDISVYIAKSDVADVVGSIGLNDYQSRKLPSIKYLLDT